MADIAISKKRLKKRFTVVKIDKNRAVFLMKRNFDGFFILQRCSKVSKMHKKKTVSLVEISNMYLVNGKIWLDNRHIEQL